MEDSVSRWVKFVEETGIAHHKVNEIAHTCADEFASPETLWSIISHQKEDEAKSFMEQLIPNPFSRAAFFSHLTRCFSSCPTSESKDQEVLQEENLYPDELFDRARSLENIEVRDRFQELENMWRRGVRRISIGSGFNLEGVNDGINLGFEGFKITGESMELKLIAQLLRLDSVIRITGLNLFNNELGDFGCRSIAQSLKQNKTIVMLSLWNTRLNNNGCHALAEVLKNNNTLSQLYIGENEIADLGVDHLSNALHSNTSLTFLDMQHNNIGDIGCDHIIQALNYNSTLLHLQLFENRISTEKRNEICQIFQSTRGESGSLRI